MNSDKPQDQLSEGFEREDLIALLKEAREKKQLIKLAIGGTYLPDELEELFNQGKFLWGIESFELVKPEDHLKILHGDVFKAQNLLNQIYDLAEKWEELIDEYLKPGTKITNDNHK